MVSLEYSIHENKNLQSVILLITSVGLHANLETGGQCVKVF